MTPNAERAAVAREVLTEMAQRFREDPLRTLGETGAQVVEAHRDEHYPAPAAPVTVTVEGYSLSPVVREKALWREANGYAWHDYDSTGRAPLFARIASDARRIEALEAANASLKAEIDRISAMRQDALDELVRVGSERDEARRAREDWRQAALTLGESLMSDKPLPEWSGPVDYYSLRPAEWLTWAKAATSQGEGQTAGVTVTAPAAVGQTGGDKSAPSPAPIPLGAVVEDGEGTKWVWGEWRNDEVAWRLLDRESTRATDWRAASLTALYHARHPVATRETAQPQRLLDAINWLMGCNGCFEASPENPYQGAPYWWRSEFAKRAGVVYDAVDQRYRWQLDAPEMAHA